MPVLIRNASSISDRQTAEADELSEDDMSRDELLSVLISSFVCLVPAPSGSQIRALSEALGSEPGSEDQQEMMEQLFTLVTAAMTSFDDDGDEPEPHREDDPAPPEDGVPEDTSATAEDEPPPEAEPNDSFEDSDGDESSIDDSADDEFDEDEGDRERASSAPDVINVVTKDDGEIEPRVEDPLLDAMNNDGEPENTPNPESDSTFHA